MHFSNECFSGRQKTFIKISGKGKTSWSKKVKGCIGFIHNLLKTAGKHLIEYCFLAVGISMGIDPAPFWANLFLHFYENQFT